MGQWAQGGSQSRPTPAPNGISLHAPIERLRGAMFTARRLAVARRVHRSGTGFVLTVLWSGTLAQVPPSEVDLTELSKESVNPVTRTITLPIRYEADLHDGVEAQTKEVFEVDKAVVPFKFNDDWGLITQTTLPLSNQPPKKHGEQWTTGLSNGYTTLFLSPPQGEHLHWGVGPLVYYPSANDAALGVDRWGSGLSAALVKQDTSPWVFGAIVNNMWTFGSGPSITNRNDSFLFNPFFSYHFSGWSLESSPDIKADWLLTGENGRCQLAGVSAR